MNFLFSIMGLLNLVLAGPIITTSLGRLQGVHGTYSDIYMGVPYAQPPIGDLAFRAPVPVEEWDTIMMATTPRSNCVQEKNRFSADFQSRDCLYLNIFVPRNAKGRHLPVIVWFHGGSFAHNGTGAATDSTLRHDMDYFADQMEAIVVTVNYRLNVFGYLYLSDLSNRFDSNCGLRDQMLAIQWVHEHIAAFGGNPHNVNLMGQSAGATSIMAIMAIPKANLWYKRVILMSPPINSFLTIEQAQERARLYLRMADIKPEKVEQLVSMRDEHIANLNKRFGHRIILNGDLRCAFSPVIDNVVLKQDPTLVSLNMHPMYIGYVAHEADLFGQQIPKSILPFMANLIHVEVPEADVESEATFSERMWGKISKDMFFDPIDAFYKAYSGPKYHYLFTYRTPQMEQQGVTCCHSLELPIVFGWETPLCNPADSATMAAGNAFRKDLKKFTNGKK